MAQARVTAGDGAGVLTSDDVAQLRGALRGGLAAPGDATYEAARRVYNRDVDRRPALVARCWDVADVMACVDFARGRGLPLAVRGGGHNVAGLGTSDGGLVADLGAMRGVWVDPQARVARVEGGATWGDVDHATHAFGLATPAGIISTTGVGGLTLGGGIGHLTRHYGLTIDNLLSVDIVTAEGELVRASEDENRDLFWAVRGGGGNFGVAASFEFRLHPVDTVYAGPVFYPADRAGEVLDFYRDYILRDAPEEMGAFFGWHQVPPLDAFPRETHLVTAAAIVACWSGAPEEGEEAMQPILDAAPVLAEHVGEAPYPAIQSAFDALLPPGMFHYWKADNMRGLPDEAIEAHLEHGPNVPNVHSTMHLYPVNGAAHRVDPDATAYAFRDADFIVNVVGVGPDAEGHAERRAWVREYWDALHPHSMGGGYVNFLMNEGAERVAATYGDHLPRLRRVKARWDPENLFRVNQNIKPEGWEAPEPGEAEAARR